MNRAPTVRRGLLGALPPIGAAGFAIVLAREPTACAVGLGLVGLFLAASGPVLGELVRAGRRSGLGSFGILTLGHALIGAAIGAMVSACLALAARELGVHEPLVSGLAAVGAAGGALLSPVWWAPAGPSTPALTNP